MDNFFIRHNSQEECFRAPFGAINLGKEVNINIEVEGPCEVYIEICKSNGIRECISMIKEDYCNTPNIGVFKATIDTGNTPGLIGYHFIINRNGERFYYGNNYDGLGGEGNIYYENPRDYQITVYKPFYVPEWYKQGIIYQIFIDRFNNGNDEGKINNPKKNSFIYGDWNDEPFYIKDNEGNIVRWDFYGGNLLGVIEKLEYIKSLGVTTIYLNPIFEAVSCHKYDTGDYKKIDPMFGDEDIFKRLCEEAKKLGIGIVLDGVFSHTGVDSKYFNKFGNYDSLGAYEAKESPYYNWYRFYDYPSKYECWWGIDNQPNVEELEPSYVNYIINARDSVVNKWMGLGASGWRLDVADELPDEFIYKMKKKIKEINSEAVLIGEVWEDASNKISYDKHRAYLYGEELDSITNYPFRDNIISFLKGDIDGYYFSRRIMSLYENYPKESFYSNMNMLGTHDTERIFTMLDENQNSLKHALIIQMTFPGVPLIYYGDEAGLTGGKDPMNRKTYPWGKENKDILDIYKKLTTIRKENSIFAKGDFKIYNVNQDVICFERNYKGKKAIIAVNRNENEDIKFNINIQEKYIYEELLSGSQSQCIDGNLEIILKPKAGKILLSI